MPEFENDNKQEQVAVKQQSTPVQKKESTAKGYSSVGAFGGKSSISSGGLTPPSDNGVFQRMADKSGQVRQLQSFQEMANNSSKVTQLQSIQKKANNNESSPIQKKENNTGLPDNLKSGIENLSGYSMDDVKVHYNSDKPAQLQAHAYAQGTDIHLGAGQEKHLPHEAWHVVQQKQGRVKPTLQMKGKVNVNDDKGLEHEADVMGAKALQMKSSENYNLNNSSLKSKHNPVQMMRYREVVLKEDFCDVETEYNLKTKQHEEVSRVVIYKKGDKIRIDIDASSYQEKISYGKLVPIKDSVEYLIVGTKYYVSPSKYQMNVEKEDELDLGETDKDSATIKANTEEMLEMLDKELGDIISNMNDAYGNYTNRLGNSDAPKGKQKRLDKVASALGKNDENKDEIENRVQGIQNGHQMFGGVMNMANGNKGQGGVQFMGAAFDLASQVDKERANTHDVISDMFELFGRVHGRIRNTIEALSKGEISTLQATIIITNVYKEIIDTIDEVQQAVNAIHALIEKRKNVAVPEGSPLEQDLKILRGFSGSLGAFSSALKSVKAFKEGKVKDGISEIQKMTANISTALKHFGAKAVGKGFGVFAGILKVGLGAYGIGAGISNVSKANKLGKYLKKKKGEHKELMTDADKGVFNNLIEEQSQKSKDGWGDIATGVKDVITGVLAVMVASGVGTIPAAIAGMAIGIAVGAWKIIKWIAKKIRQARIDAKFMEYDLYKCKEVFTNYKKYSNKETKYKAYRKIRERSAEEQYNTNYKKYRMIKAAEPERMKKLEVFTGRKSENFHKKHVLTAQEKMLRYSDDERSASKDEIMSEMSEMQQIFEKSTIGKPLAAASKAQKLLDMFTKKDDIFYAKKDRVELAKAIGIKGIGANIKEGELEKQEMSSELEKQNLEMLTGRFQKVLEKKV